MRRGQLFLCLAILPIFVSNPAFADNVAGTSTDYFPKGVFSIIVTNDDRTRDWYGKQLHALEEVSLYPPKQNTEAYRFTWLRTFHSPMVFRFTVLDNGSATLVVKRTSGMGGYDPGVVDLRKEVALSKVQVEDLKTKLDDMAYWGKQPAQDPEGFDGAQWIVEANANGRYKMVDRWSDTDAAIQAWGMDLIRLSGVDVGEVY
jgi:hypothetical protein